MINILGVLVKRFVIIIFVAINSTNFITTSTIAYSKNHEADTTMYNINGWRILSFLSKNVEKYVYAQ